MIVMFCFKMVFVFIIIQLYINNKKVNQLLNFLIRMKLDQTFMTVSLHIFTLTLNHKKQ